MGKAENIKSKKMRDYHNIHQIVPFPILSIQARDSGLGWGFYEIDAEGFAAIFAEREIAVEEFAEVSAPD